MVLLPLVHSQCQLALGYVGLPDPFSEVFVFPPFSLGGILPLPSACHPDAPESRLLSELYRFARRTRFFFDQTAACPKELSRFFFSRAAFFSAIPRLKGVSASVNDSGRILPQGISSLVD